MISLRKHFMSLVEMTMWDWFQEEKGVYRYTQPCDLGRG